MAIKLPALDKIQIMEGLIYTPFRGVLLHDLKDLLR